MSDPTQRNKRIELKLDGPDKREFGKAVLDLISALSAAAGAKVAVTKWIRPDRDVSPGVAVSDEGYRFETTVDGVEVFAPDGTSLGTYDQPGAEAAAGTHFFEPEPAGVTPHLDSPVCPTCSAPCGTKNGESIADGDLRCATCGDDWTATDDELTQARAADAAWETKQREDDAR